MIQIGKPVDVVFCGLLRSVDLFKKSIEDLNEFRKMGLVDRILFSTWKGEVQKSGGMIAYLKENRIELFENEEPKERGYGNVWCQMKAMEVALGEIKEDKFVLKSRSDVYIKKDFLKKIFSSDKEFKMEATLPKGNIFKNKIWIVWYELTRPFYFADESFFGRRDDLKKLINYDTSFDTDYHVGPALTHIRRFIYPFLKDYDILKNSLGKHNPYGPNKLFMEKMSRNFINLKKFKILLKLNELKRFYALRKRMRDESYVDCLAAYYSILHTHFYVDGDSFPNQVSFQEQSSPSVELDLDNLENNFTSNKARLGYGGQIYVYNNKLLNNLFDGKIKETEFSKRLMGSINRFLDIKLEYSKI